MILRSATESDLDHLATVWHDAWHEAHAHLLPAKLTRYRTLADFRQRLSGYLPHLRVAGPVGRPVGFAMLKGDELYQLFVSGEARGTGVAAALAADAEQQLRARGVTVAWLACAIGNSRAARFYEKCGWTRSGVVRNDAETPDGPFALEVWRYEKRLTK